MATGTSESTALALKKKKKAGLFSSHFCLSLFTKEKEGNKGGLGVAQTPGWIVSRESPGWMVKKDWFPASQMCSVHYACPSFLPVQSSALHRMEMGRKMLSPNPAPTVLRNCPSHLPLSHPRPRPGRPLPIPGLAACPGLRPRDFAPEGSPTPPE